MGNCYARRQSSRDYIDKNIRVQRKIGAEISVCKSDKKVGFDAGLQGMLTTNREETYANSIPRVLDLVESETQTI